MTKRTSEDILAWANTNLLCKWNKPMPPRTFAWIKRMYPNLLRNENTQTRPSFGKVYLSKKAIYINTFATIYSRFARSSFARTQSRFARSLKSFRPEYEVVSPGLRVDSPDINYALYFSKGAFLTDCNQTRDVLCRSMDRSMSHNF